MEKNIDENKTYIQILVETLEKKRKLLEEIYSVTKEQTELLVKNSFSIEEFDETMEQKGKLINAINELDNGFSLLFEKVKEEIKGNKIKYKEEITKLQKLISIITELGVQIEALERQNKIKLQICLSQKRKEIKNSKANNKMAASYYKNMINQHQGQSYFLDKKK